MSQRSRMPARSGPIPLLAALAGCVPGSLLGLAELFHLGGPHLAPPLLVLIYGVAVTSGFSEAR